MELDPENVCRRNIGGCGSDNRLVFGIAKYKNGQVFQCQTRTELDCDITTSTDFSLLYDSNLLFARFRRFTNISPRTKQRLYKMQLSQIFSLCFLAGLATAAPTTPSVHRREGEEPEKDGIADAQNPKQPTLSHSQQCFLAGIVPGFRVYNVVITDAKKYTDDTCGSGFLDNLHGHGCAPSNWVCNYAADGTTMNANFKSGDGCNEGDVEGAIWNAFGHRGGVTCMDYENAGNVYLPPVNYPPKN